MAAPTPSQGPLQPAVSSPALPSAPGAPPPPKTDMAPVLQQLNLAALRTRMQDLQNTLSRILHSVHTNPSPKWSEVLGQFAMVNVELLNLVEDIKPILKSFLVYPKNVNAENAQILPIMLSSKLLPEMEEDEAAKKEQILAGMSNLPPHVQTEKLQKQIDMVRSSCDLAEKVLLDARKACGLSNRQSMISIPTLDKAQAARVFEQEKLLRGAANHGEGLRISNDPRNIPAALPQHLTPMLASDNTLPAYQGQDGVGKPSVAASSTGFVRPPTPQQMPASQLPPSMQMLASGSTATLQFANSPKPGNEGLNQQQPQSQTTQAALLQRVKAQQLQKQQQLQQQMLQMRQQPTTPPLQQQSGQVTSMMQQSAKLQQLQPTQIQQLQQQQHAQYQQHLQAQQERQLQMQQPLQLQTQVGSQMRPQLSQLGGSSTLFGNAQSSIISPNMMQSSHSQAILQQRLQQYGGGLSVNQPQRNISSQMMTDTMYMGQSSSNIGLPLQQQQLTAQQPNYGNILTSNQSSLLGTNPNNLLGSNQSSLLNTNSLMGNQSNLMNANPGNLANMGFGQPRQQGPT